MKPKLPKPVEELVAKKREKQARCYNRGEGGQTIERAHKKGMKLDPKNLEVVWKKATRLKEVATKIL